MNHFHLYNQEIFNRYLTCTKEQSDKLSYPLLVSPESLYITGKILYIGQETNTWGNQLHSSVSVEDLETLYDSFLRSEATNRPYWKFIKSMIDKPLYESVVWSNLLLCGKRDGLGTPEVSDELFQLSTEYLYHLYEISKPSHVIILSSPRLVYAKLIRSFLENIGCVMNETISSTQSILVNQEKNVIWTYHPKYLAMSKQTEKVKSICKKHL